MTNPGLLVQRFIALVIDNIVLYIVGLIIGTVLGTQELGFFVGFALGLVYQIYFLTQNNGQTPGKRIIGVRVVSSGGGGVSAVQAALRYVGYYINSFLCFVGWIWALFNEEQRGFHDLIAGTRVIDA
jgi:uncharacterized RDD family membrane protein YckC